MRPRPLAFAAAAVAIGLAAACEEKQPPPRYIGADGSAQETAPPAAAVEPAPGDAPAATSAADVDALLSGMGDGPDPDAAPAVAAAGLLWRAPDNWEHRAPTNQMRAAEFTVRVPGAPAGGETAEVVVSYFGPQGAGPVEQNLERWARQVLDARGRPVVPEIESFYAGDLLVTMTAATGVYQSGMPGQAPTPRPDWTMLAAIVERGPIGPVYVRMVGPAGAVSALREGFARTLRSLEPAPVTRLDPGGAAPAPGGGQ